MLARSHVALAVAPYVAVLLRPVSLPWESLASVGMPILQLPVAAGAASTPASPLLLAILSAGVIALASLGPDLDHAGGMLARMGGLPSRTAAGVVGQLLGHRGPLHSAVAAVGAGLLAEGLGLRLGGVTGLGILVAYGWLAHVLADAVTAGGVPLLWPRWRRWVGLPSGLGPATGGMGEALEALVVVAGLLLCGGWIALGLGA